MFGQRRKPIGGLLCYLRRQLDLLEERGLFEDRLQSLAASRRQEIIEQQRARALPRVGEVGMDDNAIDVAHDQQRWILQGFPVVQQLLVRLVQVGVLALVLQSKEAVLEHVGKALAAGGFRRGGRRMADQAAEIDEVFLIG